jgi:hypothetical protein
MKKEYASRDGKLGPHGNKSRSVYKPDPPELSVRKVPADSVPFGESISRNGRTVYAAYHDGQFIAAAATADEARRAWRTWFNRTYRAIKGNG